MQPWIPTRAACRYAGLHNLGNTCFVNSVLQCLTHTPPLALGCLQLREDVLRTLPGGMGSANVMRMLAEHIRDALTSDVRPFTPSLASQMHEVSTYLTPGQQEDSHEFVRLLIDAASRQTAAERKGANGSRPFIENLFLGQLQSTVRCAVCGGISRSAEDFLDLSLEIGADGDEADAEGLGRRRGSGCGDGSGSGGTGPGGGRDAQGGHNSLMDALRAFLGVEQLEDADQYYCERCKARVCAEKQLRLHRLPPILLLHLKRFRQLRWGRSKIAGHVSFPPILDLRGLREGEQAGSDDGSEGAPEADSGVCAPVRDGSGGLGSGGEVASRSGSPPHPQAGAEPPAPSFGLRNGGANAAEAPAAEGDGRSSGRRAGRAAEVAAKLSLAHAAGSSQSHTGSGESAAFPSQTPLRSGAPARASAGQHSAAGKRPRGRKAASAAGAAAGGQAHDDGYNGRYDDRYVLYAVIVHRGRSVQSGHYLAYVHSLVKPTASGRAGDGSEGDGNPGGQGAGEAGGGDAGSGGSGWWCFDDSHVSANRPPSPVPAPRHTCRVSALASHRPTARLLTPPPARTPSLRPTACARARHAARAGLCCGRGMRAQPAGLHVLLRARVVVAIRARARRARLPAARLAGREGSARRGGGMAFRLCVERAGRLPAVASRKPRSPRVLRGCRARAARAAHRGDALERRPAQRARQRPWREAAQHAGRHCGAAGAASQRAGEQRHSLRADLEPLPLRGAAAAGGALGGARARALSCRARQLLAQTRARLSVLSLGRPKQLASGRLGLGIVIVADRHRRCLWSACGWRHCRAAASVLRRC